MNNPQTILNATQLIVASPAPVIFLDTCAVLDIIRTPQRKEIQNNIVSVSRDFILKATANPKQIWIVITTLVNAEWNDNFPKIEEELIKHIKHIDSNLIDLRIVANDLLSINTINPGRFAELKLPELLRMRGKSLLDAAVILEENNDCILRARARCVLGKPPSKKGKQEYKDCEIIEHYLDFCRELCNNDFQEKCVFVSSNKNDFCDDTKKLHPILQDEFDTVRLEYAADIAHAKALLYGGLG